MRVTAIVGTNKGAFLLRSDGRRRNWDVQGPFFSGWKVTAASRDSGGRTMLATASDVYGAAIQVSEDLEHWRQVENGPAWPKGGDRKLNQIWRFHTGTGPGGGGSAGGGVLLAGVDEAGLFRSEDRGETWTSVSGLNEHESRPAWQPGFGGLCAHALLVDPRNENRIWCGISAVGVFRSDDGGRTWTGKNEGVTVAIADKTYPYVGYCVHALVADPNDASVIWRQDHRGMYRTRDAGDSWQRIENGLPSGFGFPIAMDPHTKSLFAIPLESDEHRFTPEGRLRVYSSRDGGDTWVPQMNGLPQNGIYTVVLRGAMCVDGLDPCGVYFGTTSGTVHMSADCGETWGTLPVTLPRVLSVSAFAD